MFIAVGIALINSYPEVMMITLEEMIQSELLKKTKYLNLGNIKKSDEWSNKSEGIFLTFSLRILFSILLFISCMALGRLISFLKPQYLIDKMGIIIISTS